MMSVLESISFGMFEKRKSLEKMKFLWPVLEFDEFKQFLIEIFGKVRGCPKVKALDKLFTRKFVLEKL